MYMYIISINYYNLLYLCTVLILYSCLQQFACSILILYINCGCVCIVYNNCIILYFIRILELKQEMVNLELLEYHYFDDLLTDMKLTPVCN